MVEEQILLDEIENTRNSLSTDRLDMSFGELMSMYEKNEIIINPEFQRLFRWELYQQSRFIESLLLGIPIPPIFVAEDKEGKWEVVDGLQRLSTVFSFFGMLKILTEKNNWELQKGDLILGLENFSIDTLPLKLKLNIKRSVCRIEIVRWNSKYDLRYELFNRLNTGGAALTDQEIRNCIFRGVSDDFNKFLSAHAENLDFIKLIKPTQKQSREMYLDELVLRFCSLYAKDVSHNISQHMTEFMRQAVKNTEKISEYRKILNRTMNLLYNIGNSVFKARSGRFSPSLYDCITIGIAKNIDDYEGNSTEFLAERIEALKNDNEFKQASGSASNSRTRIIRRLDIANRIFSVK
jgi:uncharacterized protein DUF262